MKVPWHDLRLKVSLCHSKDQYHTTFSCNKHCKTIPLSKNSTLSQPRLKNKTKQNTINMQITDFTRILTVLNL